MRTRTTAYAELDRDIARYVAQRAERMTPIVAPLRAAGFRGPAFGSALTACLGMGAVLGAAVARSLVPGKIN